MKKKDYLNEIKSMAKGDVKLRLKELGEELMKLRFRKSSGQLENSHRIGEVKRKIAQVNTVLNSQN